MSAAQRGPHHRPERLHVCLVCGELRGTYGGFDNPCACDRDIWRAELPRAGDLATNVRLCRACITTVVYGSSRWTHYHCPQCEPAVQLLHDKVQRVVSPIGPHSMMNGVALRGGRKLRDEDYARFAEQLDALGVADESASQRTARRVLTIADDLGFTGDQITAEAFLGARIKSGARCVSGFAELITDIGGTPELAADIWKRTARRRPFNPMSIVVQ